MLKIIDRKPRQRGIGETETEFAIIERRDPHHPYVVATISAHSVKHGEWFWGDYFADLAGARAAFAKRGGDPEPEQISYRQTSTGVWRVTFDGRVLGDSRGFDEAEARAEALRIVHAEQRRASAEGRPSRRVFRPGF